MWTQPPSKWAHPRQFFAHVCCGQTAGWTKMALVRAVDVGPCDIVLDGDPAPPKSAQPPPQFSAHICFAKRTDRTLFYPTLRQTAGMCLISSRTLHSI